MSRPTGAAKSGVECHALQVRLHRGFHGDRVGRGVLSASCGRVRLAEAGRKIAAQLACADRGMFETVENYKMFNDMAMSEMLTYVYLYPDVVASSPASD